MNLTIDFETRSTADLFRGGAWKYAAHQSTQVMCCSVKVDDRPSVIWLPDWAADIVPDQVQLTTEQFKILAGKCDRVEAHNAGFEIAVWAYIMVPRHGFPAIPLWKWYCSAAKAAMCGLPRALKNVAGVLNAAPKDMEGNSVMMSMTKPRAARKLEREYDDKWRERVYWFEDAERFRKLIKYCKQDTETEHEVSSLLPELSDREREVWLMDQRINARGMYVDLRVAGAMTEMVAKHQDKLSMEFYLLTEGEVNSPKQVTKTADWLRAQGVEVPDLKKQTVVDLLAGELPPKARRGLEIRQSLSKSSTAKYLAITERAGWDSRARGCFMYHGASTGRWSGKSIQPQNLPRPHFKTQQEAEECIDTVLTDPSMVDVFYGDPMVAASSCVRSCLRAAPGKTLVCADFSSIEGRVLAWLAGETHVLNAYKTGRDLYKIAAETIFSTTYDEVTKDERQIGKVAELACGYQGGHRAFSAMGETYGVKVPEEQAQRIVAAWREDRPMTLMLWRSLEDAAVQAVKNPGQAYAYRGITYAVAGGYLRCLLPSGRVLYYYEPALKNEMMPWGKYKEIVTYRGVDPLTTQWGITKTYGGKLTENVVQAVARDILVDSMLRIEGAGLPIVLHVHDEIVSEVKLNQIELVAFESIMGMTETWSRECPVKAKGWIGTRYRKD